MSDNLPPANSAIETVIYAFPWVLITIWFLYSTYVTLSYRTALRRKWVNYYIFESIPNVFITLGLLGTFIGITYGLLNFSTDPNLIKTSIQELLSGLKLAFLTSIVGIILSLVFSKITKHKIQRQIAIEPEYENELNELKSINKEIASLSATLANSIDSAIVSSLKGVVEDVNDTFKKFIDQLVSDNFQRLTDSIDRLTEWQKAYHNEITTIKDAYETLVSRHQQFVNTTTNWVNTLDEIAGETSHLREIVDEFKSLTNEESRFSKIIYEIRAASVNMQEASTNLHHHSTSLSVVQQSFVEMKAEISNWLNREEGVRDSVVALSHSLHELRKFDISSIQKLDESFMNRLENTFRGLDSLLKEYLIYLENRSIHEAKAGR